MRRLSNGAPFPFSRPFGPEGRALPDTTCHHDSACPRDISALIAMIAVFSAEERPVPVNPPAGSFKFLDSSLRLGAELMIDGFPKSRSEERRVGKECRSRWSQYE